MLQHMVMFMDENRLLQKFQKWILKKTGVKFEYNRGGKK